jgi:sterol desaturase/sphingolipid hydroxylase (fatty acid hydroxylase superfamily)
MPPAALPLRTAWIWALLFAIGLAAVLIPAGPPGEVAEIGKRTAMRLIGGDRTIGGAELGALIVLAAWLLAKPLLVIGGILLLEFAFSPVPPGKRKRYWLGWAAQTLITAFVTAAVMLIELLDLFPDPLLRVGDADDWAALLLVALPAFLLSMLLLDFLEYWIHRAQHRFAFLWRFHKLHHSLDLDVLHNIRHPFDQLPTLFFVGLPGALLTGVSQTPLYLLVAFTALQGHLNHTRLPIHMGRFGWLLCDNRYHYLHHSRDPAVRDRNFAGRFPILDQLFGTYAPRSGALVEVGLEEAEAPRTMGEYLLVRLPERATRP